ncbi:MAG: OmpA family protein [Bacteroidaceae bacterium]|nr:OmpA family protein [Bacteroides sp.]MBQ4589548.1 OmpA family protein [Bacteroidaceae bacterium]
MKKIATIFILALCALPIWSQSRALGIEADTLRSLRHYKGSDNWFFGIHAGMNHSLSENARFGDFMDMTKPGFAISVGKYFSPAVGARVQLSYMKQQSRANSEMIDAYPKVFGEGNYGFHNISGYFDGLFNFNNIFGQYKESTRFNVYGILGFGFNATGGFDDKVNDWAKFLGTDENYIGYQVYTDKKAYLSLRGGLGFSYMLNNALDLNLEVTAHGSDDGYNGTRYDNMYDTYVTAMLGLTYHFKDQYGDRRFKYTTLTDNDLLDDLNARINAERGVVRQPEKVVKVEREVFHSEILNTTVSFIIDRSSITDIQMKNVAEVAKYIEEHPDINIVITGYADVKTAYPEYNMKLSKRRAESVRDALVKKFNVDPSRLRIDYKGDTVQPYKMKNEWNRVVIFLTEPRNK